MPLQRPLLPFPPPLRSRPPTAGEVYAAVRDGHTAKLQGWIASGWHVNSTDERGDTTPIQAAAIGNAEAVKVLLGAGASPKLADGLGVTPLLNGASDPMKAKLLVEAGADFNAATGTGRTSLIVAASVPGNTAMVTMLLERRALT